MHDPSDHATHRPVLDFHTHGEQSNRSKRRCLHGEETWVQRSAWNTNMNIVSLNGSNATTMTWCESFLQAVFPRFFFFLFFFFSFVTT